jgi:hypothetical protein
MESEGTSSGVTNCVEVAFTERSVFVRDSKDTVRPPLAFSRVEWIAFVEGVRNGEFDSR